MLRKFVVLLFIFIFSVAYANQKPSLSVVQENTFFSVLSKTKEGIVFYPHVKGVNKIKSWTFMVRDEDNNLVRIISGKKNIPEKIVWDGVDNFGQPVSDGHYKIEIYINADKGDLKFEDSEIIIDTVPPFVSVKAANDTYYIYSGKLNKNINLYLSCGDESGIDYSDSFISILNFKNKEINKFRFTEEIPEVIEWDGTDYIYDALVRPGNYKIIFSVFDKAGNKESSIYEISIVEIVHESFESNKLEESSSEFLAE